MAADTLDIDLYAYDPVDARKWVFDNPRSAVGSKGNVAGGEHCQGDSRIFTEPAE